MDLPELLARAGIQPEAVADLMTWARARTSVLLASLDAKSQLGQSLAPGLAQLVMRHGPEHESDILPVPPPPPVTTLEATTSREETPSRSSPRATARVISRPFLGAAVEAALTGSESPSNLSSETDEIPAPPATETTPADFDDEAAIGGFARFGVRRPVSSEPADEPRAALTHGFALHAEREASQFTEVPAPPSFESSESGMRIHLQQLTGDSERSTSLVVGIPDDEGADVPIPRNRGRSGGLEATASGSLRAATPPRQEQTLELKVEIEDPELSSALLRMTPANGETSTMLSAASSALMRLAPDIGEPSLQIPITIDDASTMLPVATVDDDAEEDDEDVTVAAREPLEEFAPTKRGGRPPPPPPGRGAQPATPTTQPANNKQRGGRGRKKIVELSTPVVRPAARTSAPEPAPTRVTREAPKPELAPLPNYLRDDDE